MRIAEFERASAVFTPVLFLSAILILFVPACGYEASRAGDPAEVLSRMVLAEESISYEGMKEISVRRSDRLTMNFPLVTHEAGGSTWFDYAGQPAGRSRRWESSRSRLGWLNDRELLLENYETRCEGRETVVGRAGIVTDIRYSEPGRPRVRVVTDAESGLLLDIRMWNHRGEMTLASRFTTLLFDPEIPPSLKDGRRRWSGKKRPDRSPGEHTFKPFEPMHLPEGFAKLESYSAGRRTSGIGTFYGDGLAWIRIEQFAAKGGEPERVVKKRVTCSRVYLSMVHKGVQIRLSGCLEPDALLKVLESLVEMKQPVLSVGTGRGGIDRSTAQGSI